jgi:hypothetical protein
MEDIYAGFFLRTDVVDHLTERGLPLTPRNIRNVGNIVVMDDATYYFKASEDHCKITYKPEGGCTCTIKRYLWGINLYEEPETHSSADRQGHRSLLEVPGNVKVIETPQDKSRLTQDLSVEEWTRILDQDNYDEMLLLLESDPAM